MWKNNFRWWVSVRTMGVFFIDLSQLAHHSNNFWKSSPFSPMALTEQQQQQQQKNNFFVYFIYHQKIEKLIVNKLHQSCKIHLFVAHNYNTIIRYVLSSLPPSPFALQLTHTRISRSELCIYNYIAHLILVGRLQMTWLKRMASAAGQNNWWF